MNASVDQDGCIGCELCADICPEVFRMNDEGLAEAYTNPVPEDAEESAQDAADSCPVAVITVE